MALYGIYENGKVIAGFAAPLTVRSNQPVSVSDTLSLKRQISKRAAQRWEITTSLEPLSYDANTLFVNLVTKGFSETINLIMPQNYGAKLKRTATVAITATGTANSTQMPTSGLVTGIVPAGTFIKFANHSKIYMLTSDLTSSNILNIFPALMVGVTSQSFTYKDDVIMSALYDTNVARGMVFSDGILMDMGSITLIEKL
jgi:hypothetical protein